MHVFCFLIWYIGHRSTCSLWTFFQKYMRHICRVFVSLSLLLSLSLSAEAVAVPEAAHASLPRLGSRWARPVRLFLSVWCENMKLLRHLFNISHSCCHSTTGQSILSINFIPETCQIIKKSGNNGIGETEEAGELYLSVLWHLLTRFGHYFGGDITVWNPKNYLCNYNCTICKYFPHFSVNFPISA